jgi:hypothetical protein
VEPPFLILRDGAAILESVPIAELFKRYRAARILLAAALSGNPESKFKVEQVFALASDPQNPDMPRALISTYLLKFALDEAEETRNAQATWRAQQTAAAQAATQGEQAPAPVSPQASPQPSPQPPPQPPPAQAAQVCKHGSAPRGVPCVECAHEATMDHPESKVA